MPMNDTFLSGAFPKTGVLYVVGTPIGNLNDISQRAIETLSTVDYILAENTVHSLQLLRHVSISTPLEKYPHYENDESFQKHVKNLLEQKNIAIISDAGLPSVSDPGQGLICEAIRKKIRVCVIPGANAALNAIIASGMLSKEFCFLGFVPQKGKTKYFQKFSQLSFPIIFYETSHRLHDTVTKMLQTFGNRKLVIARELTKKFEEYIYTTLKEFSDNPRKVRGEITIVIEGKTENESNNLATPIQTTFTLEEIIDHLQQFSTKEIVEIVQKLFVNLSKKEIYRKVIERKDLY